MLYIQFPSSPCSKIQKYSPSDSGKLWEKQLTRKSGVRFAPALCLRSAIEEIKAANAAAAVENGGDVTAVVNTGKFLPRGETSNSVSKSA